MRKSGKMSLKYKGRTNYPMCKASELGKIVINKCIDREYNISTPKIQKLLVVMQGKYLVKYQKPLFDENIMAWSCGVAIREINDDFKHFKGNITEKLQAYIILLDSEEYVIDEVLDEFGKEDSMTINSDYRLQRLLDKYYQEGKYNIIPKEEIRKVFEYDVH